MKKLKTIDINCDLGEGQSLDDCHKDAALMPYISRCNIACGGHAGNQITMRESLIYAAKNRVMIGAHPGYPDPENFGRLSMPRLSMPAGWSELQISLKQQIDQLSELANELEITLQHIKFHGALYNNIETDQELALKIAKFCFENYPSLKVLGLAGGILGQACNELGIEFIAEGFMDRTYLSDGKLTPRTHSNALITEKNKVIAQALSLAAHKTISTSDNKTIRPIVDSICLHGDNANALTIARALEQALTKAGYSKSNNPYANPYKIVNNGDAAFTIIFSETISETLSRKIDHLARIIRHQKSNYFSEVIPGYQSLTLSYQPLIIDENSLRKIIIQLLKDEYLNYKHPLHSGHSKLIEIPVCYDKAFAPDLGTVAEYNGLTEAEVISLHSQPNYLVHMLGFLPGFLYLGGLEQKLFCPRKNTPRKVIDAGSVAIGGQQTGIYPVKSPGGWQIIGRSPVTLFNPDNNYPAIASPLDQIKFVPINKQEFQQIKNQNIKDQNKIEANTDIKETTDIKESQMKFVKGGLQTSIQDLGRSGQMHLGIAHSGAMDPDSMKMANWLVAKPLDSAVIEITLSGPTIIFNETMSIAICGADFDLRLNKKKISNDKSIQVLAGDTLKFGRLNNGIRAYLAFSGEFDLQPVLSAYSTHLTAGFGGYKGRQITNGDQLNITSAYRAENRIIPKKYQRHYSGHYLLRCVESVESSQFDPQLTQRFYQQSYLISADSNRMGIRLENQQANLKNSMSITSSGLTQGSIQLPPSGQPIISSVDGQTIGGYPRIANVISADLSLLGQLKTGDKVSFVLINKAYALKILEEKNNLLNKLLQP